MTNLSNSTSSGSMSEQLRREELIVFCVCRNDLIKGKEGCICMSEGVMVCEIILESGSAKLYEKVVM